ncbi:thymidine phosphorylase [Pseudaquabacterium pictum]|uniref:Thymidine phosphorylase n=1 Tax=Pseudaquabacterium pictum TaxID=2315236 RepID=A0A480AV28_9BURK|nr:thymidine phosphorylase [Rubrivivax pictus]GCL64746.1 thymidine phosphorylase [Rubrivivax pictus]
MLPAEVIRAKRDGGALSAAQIQAFVQGLVDGRWSEGQAAALAMAILLNGMDRAECVALTRAMTHSGAVLRWDDAGLAGPVVDKHSTGGVGDKVSLVLAPIVAACGGVVPMVSGRGLGHTGGTLDKLAALPGYQTEPPRAQLLAALRSAGCAIVGASADIAPADRRLYAIRDVTATVESVPLITASILSKKLAAGLGSLVMDVKLGNGAFMTDIGAARTLARSLVDVAHGAGLPCRALITDMDQVLGTTAGNALEVQESIAFLIGAAQDARLRTLTLALAAQMLHGAGLATSVADGAQRAAAALDSGHAAEHFARMVAALGGPADVLATANLPAAPVQLDVPAPRAGVLAATDTRALGLAVVALGGGRRVAGDAVDPRVGFSQVQPLGSALQAGDALLRVHAASRADAEAACAAVLAASTMADTAPPPGPVVIETL